VGTGPASAAEGLPSAGRRLGPTSAPHPIRERRGHILTYMSPTRHVLR
jgi:hypothetical protein